MDTFHENKKNKFLITSLVENLLSASVYTRENGFVGDYPFDDVPKSAMTLTGDVSNLYNSFKNWPPID